MSIRPASVRRHDKGRPGQPRESSEELMMPTITPFLWFDNQAEQAMQFYVSIFKNARVISVMRAGDRVMSVQFEVEGQKVMGMNAGPAFTFNESFSFLVSVRTQQEIDEYWEKLTAAGGSPGRCGWLKDQFGLSWQIVPDALGTLLSGSPDPVRSQRAGQALMSMNKIDLAELQRAYDGA
jgi:predicted 3-demethylubiquinone-9 3-methyltransferase (glyoxalase superfamily)